MVQNKFLPFAQPDIGDEEIAAVVQTMKSGWVTTGPKTREFEQAFAAFVGNNVEAIAVNSATSGLHLALEACGVGLNDEVIIPTLTFTATAEVIRYLGAHPVFVDCDLNTLNLDITQIEQKITQRTKAIIPVHVAGLPCDMEAIIAIARKHNLRVIEDAAHALPSKIDNILIGQHQSDVIVYSFYATKTITTGEGGMIVTKDAKIAKRCKIMRLHGIDRDAFDRYTSNKPAWQYDIVAPGYKYNLSDIASSIGLVQLSKVNLFQEQRSKMATKYNEELANLPLILPPQVKNVNTDKHAWHLYIIQLEDQAKLSRNEFIQQMSDNGIGTSVHFIPLHLMTYWKNEYKLKPENFPQATRYFNRAVSLPIYTKMTQDDQDNVISVIKKILT
jgi:dTDP-4-amino-4,6-dideoxygalactose transaminase